MVQGRTSVWGAGSAEMGWRWAFMGMDSWYSLEGKLAGEKVMVIVRRNKTWRDDATHHTQVRAF